MSVINHFLSVVLLGTAFFAATGDAVRAQFFAGGSSPNVAWLSADAAERYAAIVPRAEELKWQQIPWLNDLAEGIGQARQEKRPLLVWVSGDDPLERC
jgi:hypothetical protein